MPEQKQPGRDLSQTAKATIAKLSEDEAKRVHAAVKKALDEHDLPRYRAGLLKLGYRETSAEYEELMRLFDEYIRASRHD